MNYKKGSHKVDRNSISNFNKIGHLKLKTKHRSSYLKEGHTRYSDMLIRQQYLCTYKYFFFLFSFLGSVAGTYISKPVLSLSKTLCQTLKTCNFWTNCTAYETQSPPKVECNRISSIPFLLHLVS